MTPAGPVHDTRDCGPSGKLAAPRDSTGASRTSHCLNLPGKINILVFTILHLAMYIVLLGQL